MTEMRASVHDFPNIEECKLFEGIKCDKCSECENEMKEWLIFNKELSE